MVGKMKGRKGQKITADNEILLIPCCFFKQVVVRFESAASRLLGIKAISTWILRLEMMQLR